MKQATLKFFERVFGSLGRELVRIGFTIAGIYIFLNYGAKRAADCDSVLPVIGVKTNAAEMFAVLIVFGAGLGVALAMKAGEWAIAKLKKP